MSQNKLFVRVKDGRVVTFEHSQGDVIFTLKETAPGRYYGSCDADGAPACARDASLDEALNAMNANPIMQRPWRELLQLRGVTEQRILQIDTFQDVQLRLTLL